MGLLANSNAIESGGYNIDRSLRFRSSASAYLSKTLTTPTNNQKWTLSAWCKLGSLSGYQMLLSANSGSYRTYFYANYNNNTIAFYQTSGVSYPILLNTGVPLLRDPSAWYHIVLQFDTTQATASNRVQIYVNNQLYTFSGSPTYPALNNYCDINTAVAHNIGRNVYSASEFFDGYLAEVNFIDGQALTPSSFGQTDAVTGVWQPKKYTGTYGTNGFYLNFSDNTSATTLAYDKSGNGNNWTPNNISTTAGATYDSMTDVPTLTSATAANYATLNPLTPIGATLSYGNLRVTGGDTDRNSTILMSSGKWYAEVTVTTVGAVSCCGVSYGNPITSNVQTQQAYGYGYYNSGVKQNNATSLSYGATYTSGDIIGIAYDADAGSLEFYKNGTSQGVAYSSMPTSSPYAFFVYGRTATTPNDCSINFGQRPFSYTPPTGFKALNTFNLPDPTIKKPNQYMDATTYTGTGSALSVTNSGSFQPDFVWIKGRSSAYNHGLFDSVRGARNVLQSNATAAEVLESAGTSMTSFDAGGFSLGTNGSTVSTNVNAQTFVGWQWKESATAGFDIVTYTGTGVNGQTYAHSLGVAPKMMIVKPRVIVDNWNVYHDSLGATKVLYMNLTNAVSTNATLWNNTAPTSSVFTVGTNSGINTNGSTYVAYLFAEIAGFSKFGSYTGNGSADGPFVFTNFQPKYVMIKRTDSTGDWRVIDTSRSPYNQITSVLQPDLSAAEATENGYDILSNGFKLRGTVSGINASGGTFVYAAFASYPFKNSNAF